MSELDRRQALAAAGIAALGTAVSALPVLGAEPAPSPTPPHGKSPMTYEIKPLPFDPGAISGFSEKILVSHHANNYGGAVKRLNAISAQLAGLDWVKAPNFVINGLKREELSAANSVILHEYYFAAFAGRDSVPYGKLGAAIARDFGSFDKWRAEFSAMGRAEGGGSGWVVLAYSPHDRRLMNVWASDHTTNLVDGRPILVLDMYEHAYHMDFGAKAADYVDSFMAALKWDSAADLYQRASVRHA